MQNFVALAEENPWLAVRFSFSLFALFVSRFSLGYHVSHYQPHIFLTFLTSFAQELDVEAVNADLAARREHFEGVLASGAFWEMTDEEKEKVSPEVQRLDWLPLSEAVRHCLSSMVPGKDVIFVNECAFSRVSRSQHSCPWLCDMGSNVLRWHLVVVAGISGMSSPSTVRSGVIRCLSPQRA